MVVFLIATVLVALTVAMAVGMAKCAGREMPEMDVPGWHDESI